MAVANIVKEVRKIIRANARKYELNRADLSVDYHTSVIYRKTDYYALVEKVINILLSSPPPRADIIAAVDAVWGGAGLDQVIAKACVANADMPTITNTKFYRTIAMAEQASGQKATEKNDKNGGSAIAIVEVGNEITVTLLNSYRYQLKAGRKYHESNMVPVTTAVTETVVGKTLDHLGEKYKKTSLTSATRQQAGDRGEHHTAKSTVATKSLADDLTNVSQAQLKALSAGKGKYDGDSAFDTVMNALELRIHVLDKDQSSANVGSYDSAYVLKDDIVTLEIRPSGTSGNEVNWDSKGLQALLTTVERTLPTGDQWKTFRGSKPMGDKLIEIGTAVAIGKIIKGSKKNLKWTENKAVTRPKKVNKTSNAASIMALTRGGRKLKKYVGKKVRPTKAMKSRVQGKAGVSPIALRTLLNTLLPRAVASKMVGGKTLGFRTGRFAGSAEVTNVTQGAKGGMQIDYTYMKYPYQTFEPGFAQGSTFRDPRLLIGQSVRELATSIMEQKFTGRVRRI